MRSFNVRCPACSTEFPVDPKKVPAEGVSAICSQCDRVFDVRLPKEGAAGPAAASPAPEAKPVEPLAPVSLEVAPPPVSAVEPGGPISDLIGAEELQIDLESGAASAAPAPPPPTDPLPPPKKQTIPMPKGKPPFVDLSSFANEALAADDAAPAAPSGARNVGKERFGKRDPHERAQHLARVLVSDIIAYYPVRYQESLSRGTLKQDFENEVKKSWKEYVDQVGLEMAESTPYFNQALNEVLARGKNVF